MEDDIPELDEMAGTGLSEDEDDVFDDNASEEYDEFEEDEDDIHFVEIADENEPKEEA